MLPNMPSKEQKLQVALGHLMDNLPYRAKDELPDFIRQMPNEGIDWWLQWAQDAIKRRRSQDALAYRLQQREGLRQFPPQEMQRLLNQFSNDGIVTWLDEIKEGKYPLAIIEQPEVFSPERQKALTEVFHDLFREIVWVHQYISPALYSMDGIEPMAENLATVAYEQRPLEDVGIYKGKLFMSQNGTYVPQETELFCPFDYTSVDSGLMLTDHDESFAVMAFHSQKETNGRLPPRTQFSIITTQDPDLKNLQQLRMQFYNEINRPCPSADCSTIMGDLTTLEDGNLTVEESFVLRQHLHKPLFYREVR